MIENLIKMARWFGTLTLHNGESEEIKSYSTQTQQYHAVYIQCYAPQKC